TGQKNRRAERNNQTNGPYHSQHTSPTNKAIPNQKRHSDNTCLDRTGWSWSVAVGYCGRSDNGPLMSTTHVVASRSRHSVLRYSITAQRSSSLSTSPNVWPPLPRPGCEVSYTFRRSIAGSLGSVGVFNSVTFPPTRCWS